MPKLPLSREIIAVLLAQGFVKNSQKGSHQKFCKGEKTVIIPAPKKEIPIGTLQQSLNKLV